MKKSFVVFFTFTLTLFATTFSAAMSLGNSSGAPLIGRPLDIAVQAVLDEREDVANLCIRADVFYADNRLDNSRVRVTAERKPNTAQEATIRVRAATLIDEPIVTLQLRVGCKQQSERRYVLLADLVLQATPEPVNLPLAGSASANLSGQSSSLKLPGLSNSSIPTAPSASSRLPAASASAELARSSTPLTPLKSDTLNKVSKPSRKERGSTNAEIITQRQNRVGPRLQLEPFELNIERDPQLKPSFELLTPLSSNLQERSAAAALWRALSLAPQDMVQQAEKFQTLETAVLSLQAQNQKTQLAIDEMSQALQKAQTERYANWIVYGLLLLLLATIAAIVFLLRRSSAQGSVAETRLPWWRKKGTESSEYPLWGESSRPLSVEQPGNAGGLSSERGSELKRYGPFAAKQVFNGQAEPQPGEAQRAHFDFTPSMSYSGRAVKIEELFDVQQQADFFVSVGQQDQAIELLRSHLSEGHETSALVYLDLLNLYHLTERRQDYAALSEEFNDKFNAQVPLFDLYSSVGPGLDSYQVAMSRIEALWPSPKVLRVIEESLFRQPDASTATFNIEAYRDLLLLYAIAREVTTSELVGEAPSSIVDLVLAVDDSYDSRSAKFQATSMQSLRVGVANQKKMAAHEPYLKAFAASTIPPASLRLGLDLDLTEPFNPDRAIPLSHNVEGVNLLSANPTMSVDLPNIQIDRLSESNPAVKRENLLDFDWADPVSGKKRQSTLPDA